MNQDLDVLTEKDVSASVNDLSAIKQIVETHGFCLIKSAFSPNDMLRIYEGMRDSHKENNGEVLPDLLSCSKLNWLLKDSRILNAARSLLGPQLVYYAETAINYEEEIGKLTMNPYRDLHADAVGLPGKLMKHWQPDPAKPKAIFPSYRFAIYMQDYRMHSGGLKVVPGSHLQNHRSYEIGSQKSLWQKVAPDKQITNWSRNFPIFNVPSEPGDLVVWNLHTRHSAGAIRIKYDTSIALLPDIEKKLLELGPEFICPIPGIRNAIFFDYGSKSQEVDLYSKSRAVKRCLDIWKAQSSTLGSSNAKWLHETWRYDNPIFASFFSGANVDVRFDPLILSLSLFLISVVKRANGDKDSLFSPNTRPLSDRLLALCKRHEEYSPYYRMFDLEAVKMIDDSPADALLLILNGAARFGIEAGILTT